MFQQLLTPVSGNLGLSFVVAILPILTVLILLGALRRPPGRLRSPASSLPSSSPSGLEPPVGLALTPCSTASCSRSGR